MTTSPSTTESATHFEVKGGYVARRALAASFQKGHIGLQGTCSSPQTMNSYAGNEQTVRISLSFAGENHIPHK